MRKLILLLVLVLTACAPVAQENGETVLTEQADVATAVAPATPSPAPQAPATRIPADSYADLEIITLLPPDAIPAIDDPQFLTIPEADEFYDADELVMGIIFNGEARAYSIPFLSNHEIVNDTVGGVKIAVTW